MLYLASRSPRRAELLRQIGTSFDIVDASIDESWLPAESLETYVGRVAAAKARAAASLVPPSACILAADTAGECAGEPLVKPRDEQHGMAMLSRMSGRSHQVSTAVCLFQPGTHRLFTKVVTSTVHFRQLTEQECRAYWASGEPHDKAGCYAIQGLGGVFVERLEGSYSGVVGLPLCETAVLLQEAGIPLWHGRL